MLIPIKLKDGRWIAGLEVGELTETKYIPTPRMGKRSVTYHFPIYRAVGKLGEIIIGNEETLRSGAKFFRNERQVKEFLELVSI